MERMKTIFQMLKSPLMVLWAISLLAAVTGCSREPSYEGVGLKLWVKQLQSEEPALRSEAAAAIGRIGRDARSAETYLRLVASTDPLPNVRVAAINALKGIGAPTREYDDYLAEITAPLIPPLSEEDSLDFVLRAEAQQDYRKEPELDDDLDYLKQFEEDTTTSESSSALEGAPADQEEHGEWVEWRKSEAISNLLTEIRNPEVLAGLLGSGDSEEKLFAARLLAYQEGGINERVVAALQRLATDPDTTLKKLATEALKKWTKE